MPTPQEVKPGGRGFGQRRFLIRGRIFAPEEQTSALRVFYNEYPERLALNPEFPQPGRRGGSRAPVATGAPAGAGGLPSPQTIFPSSRLPRDPQGVTFALTQIPPVGSLPGTAITLGNSALATASTEVLVSQRIPQPFIVREILLHADIAAAVSQQSRVKVADNNDVTGGLTTSGEDIEQYAGTAQFMTVIFHHVWARPNYYVAQAGRFIKTVFVNNSGVNVSYQFVISIELFP